jgi:predicted RNA binding protein YcfA (HicA-like mRNA interferase family)
MKRRDITRRLATAGLTFEEGGSHTIVYRDGVKVSVISRQREINETIVRRIEKQTGVKLK